MALAMNNHVFKGHRALLGSRFVTYGELELPTRYSIYQKSESFDWGNNNRGALQLAFAMLYQVTKDHHLASIYADQYTQDSVRTLSSRDWIVSASDVLEWIQKNCEEQNTNQPPSKQLQSKKTKKRKTNVVKEICKELGITQKQLAEILEVPEGTVSSWAVKNEIPRLGKKAIEFYMQNIKNQKIVDSYKQFIDLLQAS